MYSFKDTKSIMIYTLQETAMNMLKALEDVIKKEHNSEETLEGFIQLEEAQEQEIKERIVKLQEDVEDGSEKERIFTLRLREKLNDRFEKATKFEGTTKSKVLRSLIEFYIVQVEQEMENEENKLNHILMIEDAAEQYAALMTLSEEEQLQFLKLKKTSMEADDREKAINKK